MKISLLSPVRGRPEGIKAFYDSIVETVAQPDKLSIIFGVDGDDHEAEDEVTKIIKSQLSIKTSCHIFTDDLNLGFGTSKRWNVLYHSACPADIYGFGSNDVVFKTKGWDDILREVFSKLPDQIGMAYANDSVHGKTLATHPFVMRKWVQTLGYIVPEWMYHYYVDNFIHSVAMTIKRCQYMPNFVVEHCHPCVNKAPVDAVYNNNMDNCWKHDQEWFEKNGQEYVRQEAEKLEKEKALPNL